MMLNKGLKTFAVFGIIGLLCVIANFIGNVVLAESKPFILGYVSIIAWIFLMFGVIAVYISQVENLRVLGLVSTVILIIAMLWTVGILGAHEFAFPVIHDLNPSIDLNTVIENKMPSPIREADITSSYLMMVGPILYGLSIFLYSKTARWPGVLFIIVGLSSFLDSYVDILSLVGYLGFPIAISWMCIKLLRTKNGSSAS